MVAKDRADDTEKSSPNIMQIRWLWREQCPFKVSKRIPVRMRDLFGSSNKKRLRQQILAFYMFGYMYMFIVDLKSIQTQCQLNAQTQ